MRNTAPMHMLGVDLLACGSTLLLIGLALRLPIVTPLGCVFLALGASAVGISNRRTRRVVD